MGGAVGAGGGGGPPGGPAGRQGRALASSRARRTDAFTCDAHVRTGPSALSLSRARARSCPLACMHVRTHSCKRLHARTHARARVSTFTRRALAHERTLECTYTQARSRKHACAHVRTLAHTRTARRRLGHAHPRVCKHTHTLPREHARAVPTHVRTCGQPCTHARHARVQAPAHRCENASRFVRVGKPACANGVPNAAHARGRVRACACAC
jgi:hypothetical protein